MPTYQIRRGDTLTSIAEKYGTSISALTRANGISDADEIAAGQQLRLPGARSRTPGHSTVDSFEPAAPLARSAGDVQGSTALAEAGRRTALRMGGYHSEGLCARGVERSIRNAMGVQTTGNANQLDNNLPRGHFREVNMSLQEALNTPGMVLTWERTGTRAGRKYGHTAITAGDGHTSYSDFVERDTVGRSGRRTGLRVFAPLNA